MKNAVARTFNEGQIALLFEPGHPCGNKLHSTILDDISRLAQYRVVPPRRETTK